MNSRRCCESEDQKVGVPAVQEQGTDDEEVANLTWAIAHPARVRILRILLARPSCVCGELVELMPLAQSTVSQHLKILKQAGLVQGEIDGPRVCYCVNRAGLARFKELVAAL
jgi:ArsR family transcriptional regulator